jgi:hypothetical protein
MEDPAQFFLRALALGIEVGRVSFVVENELEVTDQNTQRASSDPITGFRLCGEKSSLAFKRAFDGARAAGGVAIFIIASGNFWGASDVKSARRFAGPD